VKLNWACASAVSQIKINDMSSNRFMASHQDSSK